MKNLMLAVGLGFALSTTGVHGNELLTNTLCVNGLDDTYSSIQPIQREVWVLLWDRLYVTTTGCVDVLVPSDHGEGRLVIYAEGFDLIDVPIPPGTEDSGALYLIELERRFLL